MNRNVLLLAVANGAHQIVGAVAIATLALVGLSLAPDPAWSTVPAGVQYATMLLCAYPASLLMARFGRRSGFLAGTAIGVIAVLVVVAAITQRSYFGLILGCILVGAYNTTTHYYRFAAAEYDSSTGGRYSVELVFVLGVAAAFIGPWIADVSRSIWPDFEYAGPYLVSAPLILLGFAVTALLPRHAPHPAPSKVAAALEVPSSLGAPRVVLAFLTSAACYIGMNSLMIGMPLIMQICGFDFRQTTTVLQWHIFAMFAPSLVTGYFINKVGPLVTIMLGVSLMMAVIAINVSGVTYANFMAGMIILGLAWNLMYLSATRLLTELTGDTKTKAQGLNEMIVFGCVAMGSSLVGFLQRDIGWAWLNLVLSPILALPALMAMAILVFEWRGQRPQKAERI